MPKEIKYNGENISDTDLEKIMFSLPEETTLLDLSNNHITDEGVKTIFRYLINNKLIEELNLDKNKITLAGCLTILKTFKENGTNLRKLNIADGLVGSLAETHFVSKEIETKLGLGEYKKPGIGDNSYHISTPLVSKVNQSKSASAKNRKKRNHIIKDHKTSSPIIHSIYKEKYRLLFDTVLDDDKDNNEGIELSSFSKTDVVIKTIKTKADKYEISTLLPEINQTSDLVDRITSFVDVSLQKTYSSDKIIKLQNDEQAAYDQQNAVFLHVIQESIRSSEIKDEDFALQWNGIDRKLQELRKKLRSFEQSPATDTENISVMIMPNNTTADPLAKTSSNHLSHMQIEQIELATELFNIKLTQVFTKALAIRYQLVDAHNQSRVGTVLGGAISIISALVPLPGASLVGQGLVAFGKVAMNKFITLSAQKIMEERDIKRHDQRLGKGGIGIDEAAKIVKALVDGLTLRYQLVLAKLYPESLEVFVNCVIQRMMNYWDKKVPDKFKKEGGMMEPEQGLFDFSQSPYQFIHQKRTLTEDEKFKYFIENMIIGSSLWKGRKAKNSGFLAKKSSGSGKIAKIAGYVTGDRLIKYRDSKGEPQTAMVQKICRDSPVITWLGDSNESGLPQYRQATPIALHNGATTQHDFPALYLTETECRLRRYEIGMPIPINLHIQPKEFKKNIQAEKVITQQAKRIRKLKRRLMSQTKKAKRLLKQHTPIELKENITLRSFPPTKSGPRLFDQSQRRNPSLETPLSSSIVHGAESLDTFKKDLKALLQKEYQFFIKRSSADTLIIEFDPESKAKGASKTIQTNLDNLIKSLQAAIAEKDIKDNKFEIKKDLEKRKLAIRGKEPDVLDGIAELLEEAGRPEKGTEYFQEPLSQMRATLFGSNKSKSVEPQPEPTVSCLIQ